MFTGLCIVIVNIKSPGKSMEYPVIMMAFTNEVAHVA